MARPEKELTQDDFERSVKTCRRLLCYLLRGFRLRVHKDAVGERRFREMPSELSESLVPLIVSERTPLGFFRALCTRFHVDPAGGDYGSLEAWLPEGRIRWDRAVAAMDHRHMRLVIHENPSLLATFACDCAAEGEDALFDCFPDAPARGTFVPTLPGQLVSPTTYQTIWTLLSPLAHGADQKGSNVNLFRRECVVDPLTGEQSFVPFLAGNAVRGQWRDLAMSRWLELIGLSPRELPKERVHSLFSGGAVEQGADGASVNLTIRRRARELCPPWDLLAGVTDQQIMSGTLRVHDAVLLCRENAWLVYSSLGLDEPVAAFASSLPEASELTRLRLGTRHAHRDYDGSDGQQMIFNTEVVIKGCQLLHSFQLFSLEQANDITLSCLADLLELFRADATVAAQPARGLGRIAFEGYFPGPEAKPLPSPGLYREHVASMRDPMRDWALRQNEPPPQKPAKAKRGKAKEDASCLG